MGQGSDGRWSLSQNKLTSEKERPEPGVRSLVEGFCVFVPRYFCGLLCVLWWNAAPVCGFVAPDLKPPLLLSSLSGLIVLPMKMHAATALSRTR